MLVLSFANHIFHYTLYNNSRLTSLYVQPLPHNSNIE